MSINLTSEFGIISIQSNVIAAIAGYSALNSYGIVGMARKSTKEGIFELLKMDNITKGIMVNLQENEIVVDLHVILEYGVQISVVAQNIVDAVKYNVKLMTGLEVDNVNVIVQGIRID